MTPDNHSRLYSTISRMVNIEPQEVRAVLWSFSYFFSLLCGYYIVRPMREEMGILAGLENMHWLFTGTMLVMIAIIPLYGWVSSRFPRHQFLPFVYLFFISNLVVFYYLMGDATNSKWVARAFFSWVSVFNLFIVSVFWSFMADLYSNEQARRLFAFIASGGTLGALAGPTITAMLAEPLGTRNLLLISAGILTWAILSIHKLSQWSKPDTSNQPKENQEQAIGGGILAGLSLVSRSPYLLSICAVMLLFTMLTSFLYFMQAQIVSDAFVDSTQRTKFFATIDLAVNALTLFIQVFVTSRLVKRFGLAVVLASVPLIVALGFSALSFAPVLVVLVTLQVVRRAGEFAVMKPAREMLYVVLSREEKYKAKNVIDTVVYRTGDTVSAWSYAAMRGFGMQITAIAMVAVPLALAWAWLSYNLGKQQSRFAEQQQNNPNHEQLS